MLLTSSYGLTGLAGIEMHAPSFLRIPLGARCTAHVVARAGAAALVVLAFVVGVCEVARFSCAHLVIGIMQ